MSKQSKAKLKNEKIKRKYLHWMENAQGFSEKSIAAIEKAMWKYEDFIQDEDYGAFSSRQAEQFKKYLQNNVNKRSGRVLGLTSQYHHLRHIKNFFMWLSGQPGYKSRVSPSDVMYLQLSKKDRRQATATKSQQYPTLQQVKTLCGFEIKNEIDQRDRALLAFTALTGMRDLAVVTVPIGCFDAEKLVVDQDPKRGVETKFSKTIETTLFVVDKELIAYVVSWYHFLIDEKKFGIQDPLFPATELGFISDEHHAFEAKGISRTFWADAGQMRKIFKQRSKQTGVPYFSPHKFRHFIINEVKKHITSMEQLKAISQNLGHENIATTFHGYGAIDNFHCSEIVRAIDFSGLPQNQDQVAMAKVVVEEVLKQMGKK